MSCGAPPPRRRRRAAAGARCLAVLWSAARREGALGCEACSSSMLPCTTDARTVITEAAQAAMRRRRRAPQGGTCTRACFLVRTRWAACSVSAPAHAYTCCQARPGRQPAPHTCGAVVVDVRTRALELIPTAHVSPPAHCRCVLYPSLQLPAHFSYLPSCLRTCSTAPLLACVLFHCLRTCSNDQPSLRRRQFRRQPGLPRAGTPALWPL